MATLALSMPISLPSSMDRSISSSSPSSSSSSLAPIASLPPELLDAVLATLPTPALLPLAAVSRRFHNIIARLLYRRLRRALASPAHELIVECYHPTATISTPYLHCAYQGTDGFDQALDGIDDVPGSVLLKLPSMYSRFRPLPPDEADAHVRNYRAIQRTLEAEVAADVMDLTVPLPKTNKDSRSAITSATTSSPSPLVAYDVCLDEGESFSQLRLVTNLVRKGPRRGLFTSCAKINDGVVRVWRDWLARHNTARAGGQEEQAKTTQPTSTTSTSMQRNDDAVLWAYMGKHVGMRFRVTASEAEATEMTTATADDDQPVSYQLECEELLVNSYEFLLAMEKAEMQQAKRAVVASQL